MALTKIKADGLTADLIDETKLADNSIDSEHYNDGSIDNAHLADDAVGVAELSATGTASSSTFLRGDNSWQAISTTPEGTAVLSTGETGTAKFLRVDGDNSCSWQVPPDTNTQLAFANDANNRVVTGDGSGGLNGEANLTFDGNNLDVSGGCVTTFGGNSTNEAACIKVGYEGSSKGQVRVYGADASTTGSLEFKVCEGDGSDDHTMLFDGSGNLGINTASPEDLLHIKSGKLRIENAIVSNNDSTISYDNSDFLIDVDPNNVRGSSQFKVNIDTVAALTVDDNRNVNINDGDLVIATSGHGIRANGPNNSTYGELKIQVDVPDSSGSNNEATFKKASSGIVLAFPSGGGIDFSATANSSGSMGNELLDDYEEGTWTPSINTSANVSVSVGAADYTKIGRIVNANCYITYNGSPTTDTDAFKVLGLPFTSKSGNHFGNNTIQYMHDFTFTNLRPLVYPGDTYVYFHYSSGSGSTVRNNHMVPDTDAKHLILGISYFAA